MPLCLCRASFIPQRALRPHLVSSLATKAAFLPNGRQSCAAPLPFWILNRNEVFVWPKESMKIFLRAKVVTIHSELSSGKFLLIKFCLPKNFGSWQWWLFEQTRIFLRICSGKLVRWMVRFLFDYNQDFGFASTFYQQTTLLIIEKGLFTWVQIKLIWLLIFWPPWLPQLAFHHRCLRPHLQDDNREIENS